MKRARELLLTIPVVEADRLLVTIPVEITYAWRESPSERWTKAANNDLRLSNRLWNEVFQAPLEKRGGSLAEACRVGDVSLWQFLPSFAWADLYRAVEFIEVLDEVVREKSPEKISFQATPDQTADIWSRVVREFCSARGIACDEIPVAKRQRSLGVRVRGRLAREFQGLLPRLELQRALAWQAQKCLSGPRGKKLVFATHQRYWSPNPEKPGTMHEDHFDSILASLRARGWRQFVGIDCPYASNDRKLTDRIRSAEPDLTWRAFDSYRDGGATSRDRRELEKVWQEIQCDPGFLRALHYRGVALLPALRPTFDRAFRQIFPDAIGYLKTAASILDQEKPDAVMTIYETGPFQRALHIEAARRGIPHVGLMHGMIFDNHYDYAHARVTAKPLQDLSAFAIPDLTFVWGDVWKRNLTEVFAYPKKNVAVTGYWKADSWFRQLKHLDLARLRVSPAKKQVLILSGAIDVPRLVRTCLELLRAYPEFEPVIRLHPSDPSEEVIQIIQEFGLPPERLAPQFLPAVRACDFVIGQVSTSVAESILMDKPFVIVNLEKTPGLATDYLKTGACLYAEDPAALRNAFRQLTCDPETQKSLAVARQSFVKDYFFAFDGKSSERVAQALDQLVQTS